MVTPWAREASIYLGFQTSPGFVSNAKTEEEKQAQHHETMCPAYWGAGGHALGQGGAGTGDTVAPNGLLQQLLG